LHSLSSHSSLVPNVTVWQGCAVPE